MSITEKKYKRNRGEWGRCCVNIIWKKGGNRVNVHDIMKSFVGFGGNSWYNFKISRQIKRWY